MHKPFSKLQLMGWSRKRRVVVMRRRRKSPDDVALPAQTAEGDQFLPGLSEEGLCILFRLYQHFVGQGLIATTFCRKIVPAEQNA